MHLHLWTTLLDIFVLLPFLDSARILGIFPVHSKSHHSVNQPIVKGLAARGHEVTIISHFKSETLQPNYTEIVLGDIWMPFIDSIPMEAISNFNGVISLVAMGKEDEKAACESILQLNYIKQLLRSPEKSIDLIIAEMYYTQCFNLIAEKLDVRLIAILPITTCTGLDIPIGNPSNPASVPMVGSSFTTKMGFFERLENSFYYTIYYISYYTFFQDYMDDVARIYFDMKLPSEDVLRQRVALTFYNNHFSFIARPMTPNAVDIGGIHIQEAKTLPKRIQEFVDSAEHGVIFFSFGTTIRASSIPTEKMNIIKRVFSKIPQKVLWRMDDPKRTTFSANVMVEKWFPQRDILEHKNVRAFISHCGLLGTLEAIYTGTPVIAVPFLFDQHQDANVLVEKGVAVHVDYDTLTEDKFLSAINEIINNSKYLENIEKLSKIFKDRPISPLDTAIYWTEYVLKHDETLHLRPQSADMTLYQFLLLDVIVFLLTVMVLMIWVYASIAFKILRRILSYRAE